MMYKVNDLGDGNYEVVTKDKSVRQATFRTDQGYPIKYVWFNGAGRARREIDKAVKDSGILKGVEVNQLSDDEILAAETIYEIFPDAPEGTNPNVGWKCENVYQWVKERSPHIASLKYPHGGWNAFDAGMAEAKYLYRKNGDKDGVDADGYARLARHRNFDANNIIVR